ncbi:unnamed protein product [Lymnaea stagnalis]|uniref:Uncharacterized protein n=1 Tax=Lymnaea stagnalis TaxID=6523 RepID=A0AAV2I8A6_LYMST
MNSRCSSNLDGNLLMKAVADQDIELISSLIDGGAKLDARNKFGQSVLYFAFQETFTPKCLEVLQLLISKGISVNTTLDADGCTALVTAVVMNQPDLVKLLIKAGADVNVDALSKFCGTLCSDPEFTKCQFIFSKGCGHTVTPLLCSVMFKRRDIFQILLKANANCECLSFGTFWRASMSSVCSACDIQVTPLHMAAYLGDLEMTYTILHYKSDMTEYNIHENCRQSFNDITPLWFALLKGHTGIVKLFLSLGKPIAFPCHFGSGLQVCLEEGHTTNALMLLRAGYNLEDDMDWIEPHKYPTKDKEVIERIESLAGQPRPLLDWCSSSLRQRFGLQLDKYLATVQAPKKVYDILNFNDLCLSSWQTEMDLVV